MDRTPRGLRAHGRGIQIRLWKHGREVYSEIVAGDIHKPGDLAAAVRRRAELESRLRLGLPLRAERGAAALFRDTAQDYLDTLEADYSTHLSYEGILNRYWLPEFGGWLDSDIGPQEIRRVLGAASVSIKTKKNLLIPLRGALDLAVEGGRLAVNPAARLLRRRKHQRAAIARFEPAERAAALGELDGPALVYFALLFGTGIRPGEALGLDWLDWNGEEFRVHQSVVRRREKATTKTHTARRVYVPTWVRPILLAHPTRFEKGPVFLNARGERLRDVDDFNAAWKVALRRAKVPYRIPYVCRHTRAAELLSTGVAPGDAAEQLGHTLEMFYRTYAEWIERYTSGADLRRFEGFRPAAESPVQEIDR